MDFLVGFGVASMNTRLEENLSGSASLPKFREATEDVSPSHHPWRVRMRRADLLKRTLGVDVLECPRCGGRMEPIAEITEPEAVGNPSTALGIESAEMKRYLRRTQDPSCHGAAGFPTPRRARSLTSANGS